MPKTNIPRKAPSSTTLTDIKSYYYRIDFAIEELNAYDINEAKEYIKQIVFHGKVSNTDMAIYYADMQGEYQYYVDLEDDFELYPYIDHAAVKEEVEDYGDANIRSFIDYESLGRDMFQKDILIDAYYRFNGNVFEVSAESGEYIDVDIAEYCYLLVQSFINTELNIEDAIISTYEYVQGEVY